MSRNEATGETIGDRIRRLREERGLSQRQLSGPGVSNSYLSRLEKSERVPSLEAIRTLARKLGVTPEYLETGTELTAREELELALTDAELAVRLHSEDRSAAASLEAIAHRANEEGERDIAARAQATLGMALANWGNLAHAVDCLEQALAHPLMTPEVVGDAYIALAKSYDGLGRFEEATAVCERALAGTHDDHRALRTLFSTQLSYELSELGEFERAERILRDLQTDLVDSNPYERARLHWSLARVATMQDRRKLALHQMRMAIDLLRGTEDTERLARAHLLCAEILLWGETTGGVKDHLGAARALLPAFASDRSRGKLAALDALLAARKREYGSARKLADEALTLFGDTAPDAAPALYARGLCLAAEHNWKDADEMFTQALDILVASSLWREASLIATARADACFAAGDAAAGRTWQAQAQELAQRQRVRATATAG